MDSLSGYNGTANRNSETKEWGGKCETFIEQPLVACLEKDRTRNELLGALSPLPGILVLPSLKVNNMVSLNLPFFLE